jgi:carboxyl-terminal processing protease
MKKVWKILSYVLVAALASAATLAVNVDQPPAGIQKLEQVHELLSQKFIGETDETAMMDAAAEGMVASLNDRWSFYIPADEYGTYMEQMNNSYVGIGTTIQLTEDNTGILVIQVAAGGPAEEAGVLVGDVLIAVNGENIVGLSTEEVKTKVVGDAGTFVTLTFLRAGHEITLEVERRVVNTPVAVGEMLEGRVGLITIANFDARCSDETIAAMEDLLAQGARALIFDVRFNPGGYAEELSKVLDYILPAGRIFHTVDYTGNEEFTDSDASCMDMPMAVLMNGSSYSAAEFFAAALDEYDYAILVGEPTTGKGYFQNTFQLSDGSAVGLSIGQYFTPVLGRSLAEEGGLQPEILVELDDETRAKIQGDQVKPKDDPQIQAAVKALLGK